MVNLRYTPLHPGDSRTDDWMYIVVVKEEVKSTRTESENKISGAMLRKRKRTINMILPNTRQYYYIERWNWDQVEGNEYTPLCCTIQWMNEWPALTLNKSQFSKSTIVIRSLGGSPGLVWLGEFSDWPPRISSRPVDRGRLIVHKQWPRSGRIAIIHVVVKIGIYLLVAGFGVKFPLFMSKLFSWHSRSINGQVLSILPTSRSSLSQLFLP